jgi:transcriptional regulator with XRE-family HTH domain
MYRAFLFKFFAADLRKARKARKMTQAQLAEASGVRQATISKLEKQTSCDVNVATLEKLAAALHANLRIDLTLADITVKPVHTPKQLEDLTAYETERLQQLSGNRLINEIVRLQDGGKWVPDEFLPEVLR